MPFKGKILLCEDGTRGHRPTILRYVCLALERYGVAYEITCASQETPGAVYLIARKLNCTGVHFLTVDGAIRKWMLNWVPRTIRLPAVGTYYLFSNVYNFYKGLGLKFACLFSGVDALLVSDEFMKKQEGLSASPCLEFLPDPWLKTEFPERSQEESRALLGLDSQMRVFLMFGELSSRKGFDIFLEAINSPEFPAHFMAVCAGRIDKNIIARYGEIITDLIRRGRLKCYDRFIEESEISDFFYAADYVVCPYPKYFMVSSNTSTRALASGRPYITFSHGVIAETVRRLSCGYIVNGQANGLSLKNALVQIANKDLDQEYEAMAVAGKLVASSREFSVYAENLISSYVKHGLILDQSFDCI